MQELFYICAELVYDLYIMKVLASLIASILIVLVLSSCMTLVFSRTLLNGEYLSRELKSIEVYPRLTTVAGMLVAQQSKGQIPASFVENLIRKHLPEATFESRASAWLIAMETHLNKGGVAPEFALPELSPMLRDLSMNVSSATLPQTFSLPNDIDKNIVQTYQLFQQVQIWLYMLTGGLFLALFMISVKTRRYGDLVYLLMTSALLQGVLFAAFRYAPQYVIAFIPKGNVSMQPIIDSLVAILYKLLAEVSIQFAVIAAVFLVLGIIVWGLSLVSSARKKNELRATHRRASSDDVSF